MLLNVNLGFKDYFNVIYLTLAVLNSIILHTSNFLKTVTKAAYCQGKAIPLEVWSGPEGSRRLRLPDIKIIST